MRFIVFLLMPWAVDRPEFHFQEHPDSLDLVLTPFRSRILRYFFPSTEIICLFLVKKTHLLMPFNSLPQFQDDVFILTEISHHFYLANQFLICQTWVQTTSAPHCCFYLLGNQITNRVAEGNCSVTLTSCLAHSGPPVMPDCMIKNPNTSNRLVGQLCSLSLPPSPTTLLTR